MYSTRSRITCPALTYPILHLALFKKWSLFGPDHETVNATSGESLRHFLRPRRDSPSMAHTSNLPFAGSTVPRFDPWIRASWPTRHVFCWVGTYPGSLPGTPLKSYKEALVFPSGPFSRSHQSLSYKTFLLLFSEIDSRDIP